MRIRHGFAIGLLVLSAGIASAAEWFCAPAGKAANAGTMDAPWDLKAALEDMKSPVKPGDTIWLLGGEYKPAGGEIKVILQGEEKQPITVRNYQDQRATVHAMFDVGFNTAKPAKYVLFWGLEVQVRGAGGGKAYEVGNSALPPHNNPGIKIINCVLHDCPGGGTGNWGSADEHEVYGCLVYYNGGDAGDRGHGHGFYVQNKGPGPKLFKDNIIFRNFWAGTQLYGTENAFRDFVTYEGNTWFNNGEISTHGTNCNIWIGGGKIAQQPKLIENYSYSSPTNKMQNHTWYKSKDGLMKDNYFIGVSAKAPVFTIQNSNDGLSIQGNTFYGLVYLNEKITSIDEYNKYGKDSKDNVQLTEKPKGVQVFVRPNTYEPGRANITVFNWDKKDSVDVDVTKAGLKAGDKFEVRDAQDFYGKPVVTVAYDEKPISIPMTGLTVAAPIGLPAQYKTPPHTGPEFGVFVMMKTAP